MKALLKKLYIVSIAVMVFTCTGCTKRIYIPVENRYVVKDTVYSARLYRDSVYEKDYTTVYLNKDTVYIERKREKNHYSLLRDTLYKYHTDTLYKEKIVRLSDSGGRTELSLKRKGVNYLLVSVIVIALIIYLLLLFLRRRRGW